MCYINILLSARRTRNSRIIALHEVVLFNASLLKSIKSLLRHYIDDMTFKNNLIFNVGIFQLLLLFNGHTIHF